MSPRSRRGPDPDSTSAQELRYAIEAWQHVGGSHAYHEAELLTGGRHAVAIHLRPKHRSGPSVVAKLRPRGELDLERLIHEAVLPELGVETPRFLGFHTGIADEGDILFLEYVGTTKFLPFDPAHQAAAGRWLGTCHAASARASIPARIRRRSFDEDRAELTATRVQLAATLANPRLGAEGGILVSHVLELLDRATDRWSQLVERAGTVPQVLTHGAFVTRNVRMRGRGTGLVTLPFDWDHVAVRSPAVDLAREPGRTGGFGANAALDEYRDALAAGGLSLDAGVVSDVAIVGTVIRAVVCIGWLITSLAGAYVDDALAELQIYRRALEGVLNT